jgi:hypothetical protein
MELRISVHDTGISSCHTAANKDMARYPFSFSHRLYMWPHGPRVVLIRIKTHRDRFSPKSAWPPITGVRAHCVALIPCDYSQTHGNPTWHAWGAKQP